ncbi:MAG: hypothetical protein HXS52_01360 [Theionarchaea archaeon]|nr:hypothetical protein [Theionarchaea archaeon]
MDKKELIESFKAISKKWRVEFLILYILFCGATLAIMMWKGKSLILFHDAFFGSVIATVLITVEQICTFHFNILKQKLPKRF